ncbi:hypothetical protein M885DRAFT_542650 [Pelagophyceae sp. CCMP2097]|nr:hypothetical protein M885DRAFT_542650 [Pelagophyceae sp. CCMP2097]
MGARIPQHAKGKWRLTEKFIAGAIVVVATYALVRSHYAALQPQSPLQNRSVFAQALRRRRRPLQQPVVERCNNTYGTSASLVADSSGAVCAVEALGADGCCCGDGALPVCADCDGEERCCSNYEACVACCGHASRASDRSTLRLLGTHDLLHAESDFDLCRFRCLTNSGSILHQNSYRARRRHCYGPDRPTLEVGSSINCDRTDYAALALADARDPFVAAARGDAVHFPCTVDACVMGEQDLSKLARAAKQREEAHEKLNAIPAQ